MEYGPNWPLGLENIHDLEEDKDRDHTIARPSLSSTCDEESLVPSKSAAENPGRRRPECFKSTWMEVFFCISVLSALAMTEFIISGFQVVLPALVDPLEISPELQTWPCSVLVLVAGSFLFPMGRLADMYGGYILFNSGVAWFALWTVLAGFSNNFTVLVICRAMEGLAAGAFLPAGISILGKVYQPGPRKSLVFGLYGALAPMGFFSGIVCGGAMNELFDWRWFFWLGGILSGLACIGSLLTAPRDFTEARRLGMKMDWWGACTIVPGTMLVIYAITASSGAPRGWASPEVLIPLCLGVGFLMAAVYVEGWRASSPLIPASVFRIRFMKRMLSCNCFIWGAQAIFLFYVNFYLEQVADKSTLTTSLWFAPWAIAGAVLSIASGLMLHHIPGRVLLVAACVCKVIAIVLFAVMPSHPNYWAWVMPAMTAEAACIDVLWTVSNVFLTASLPRESQGLAGSIINITVMASGALFLGIADIALAQFRNAGMTLKEQYQNVFWVSCGVAGIAVLISFFIKLGKADSGEGTVDEKEAALVSRSDTTLVEQLGTRVNVDKK